MEFPGQPSFKNRNILSGKCPGRSRCSFLSFMHYFFWPAPQLDLPHSSANNGFTVNVFCHKCWSGCQSSPLGDRTCRATGTPPGAHVSLVHVTRHLAPACCIPLAIPDPLSVILPDFPQPRILAVSTTLNSRAGPRPNPAAAMRLFALAGLWGKTPVNPRGAEGAEVSSVWR